MLLMTDRWRVAVKAPKPFVPGRMQFLPALPATVAQRISRPAYLPFWKIVEKHIAQATVGDPGDAQAHEATRAQWAKALALSAWTGRNLRHAAPAKRALLAAGSGHWEAWCGMGDTMLDYVLAADLLRAMGRLGRCDFARLRERLAPKLIEGLGVAHDLPQNNWRLHCDCAVAAGALCFWHDPDTLPVDEMLASGLDGMSRMLFGQLTFDGANEEGLNYSRRSAIPVVRLGWVYRHLTGVDFVNQPQLRRWHRWQAETKRPDGRMWPTDDGEDGFELYPHALLVHRQYREAALQRWAHDRAPMGKYEWAADAMLLFDDSVKARPPSRPPSYVLRESGIAHFRTDWGREATAAVLHARPLCAFGADQVNTAHKHDDPTNFLIHSHRRLLVTEGGYGASYADGSRHHYFLAGVGHNMVLVDGRGPLRVTSHNSDSREGNTSQSAGRMVELCSSREIFGAQAITSYQNVDFRRNFFLVRGRYFVIIDEVESARIHEYSWVLHGNSMDVRTVGANGTRWVVGPARLCAYHLLPTGMPWRHYKGAGTGHAGDPPHRIPTEHMYSRVWTVARNTMFVTVLVPDAADAPMPRVRLLSHAPVALRIGVAGAARDDLFLWHPTRRRVMVRGWGAFPLRIATVKAIRSEDAPAP